MQNKVLIYFAYFDFLAGSVVRDPELIPSGELVLLRSAG